MKEKSLYTKALGKQLVNIATNDFRNKLYVTPYPANKWAVLSKGAKRAHRVFSSQSEALTFALQKIETHPVDELVVFGRDFNIAQRISGKL